eukprot:Skav201808  [mRNA]  locus=scaffold1071:142517:156252:+ [translate_table: standard]
MQQGWHGCGTDVAREFPSAVAGPQGTTAAQWHHAMAYRSLTSAHPLAFSYAGGASSSDGPAILLEQSPARSKAPSDGPSEFSSWHDDASSSLAPSAARDGTITVQRPCFRPGMGGVGFALALAGQSSHHALRPERLHVASFDVAAGTLQNDIGKLAALTCELKSLEIWRALAGFEELLEAMDHRFLELWESENAAEVDTAARPATGESQDIGGHFGLVTWSDDNNEHRFLLESLQQRLLDQRSLAEQLREELSAATREEERAQEPSATGLGR